MAAKKRNENNFWEKSPDDSADTPNVKNFVEITQFCTVSEINAFLQRENDIWDKMPVVSVDTLGEQKFQ